MFIKSIGNTVRLLNKNNGVQTVRQRRRNAKTTPMFYDHESNESNELLQKHRKPPF